jgi:hypothetical protein
MVVESIRKCFECVYCSKTRKLPLLGMQWMRVRTGVVKNEFLLPILKALGHCFLHEILNVFNLLVLAELSLLPRAA